MSRTRNGHRRPALLAMSCSGPSSHQEERAATGKDNDFLVRQPMAVGVNYPWLEYGCDIGRPPRRVPPVQRAQWKDKIVEELKHLKDLGIFAVRWFLLADGICLGTLHSGEVPAGASFKLPMPNQTDFYRTAAEDLEILLGAFGEANLLMIPVIVNHDICWIGRPDSGDAFKKGRWNIMTRAGREPFVEYVLEPLLQAARKKQHLVYAVDVINEPELCSPSYDNSATPEERKQAAFSSNDVAEFIAACATRIRKHELRATVGFQHRESFDEPVWSPCLDHLDVLQYHYYGNGQIQSHADVKAKHQGKDCLIGEFAARKADQWIDLDDDKESVWHRLAKLDEKKYPAALVWSIHATPSRDDYRTCWNRCIEDQIASFSRGAMPKPYAIDPSRAEQTRNDCPRHLSNSRQ